MITPPKDLKLNSTHIKDALIATWRDVNPKRCGVTFKVKNSATRLDHMLSNTVLKFNINYCTTTTITVISIGLRKQESKPTVATHTEGWLECNYFSFTT